MGGEGRMLAVRSVGESGMTTVGVSTERGKSRYTGFILSMETFEVQCIKL